MIEIKDLLLGFNNLILKEEMKKETVREIIGRAIGLEIKKEKIRLRQGTVYLDIKPIYKNEILLKKEKILSELANILDKKAPRDIK